MLFFLACLQNQPTPQEPVETPTSIESPKAVTPTEKTIAVHHAGKLLEMMHNGDISAKISLQEFSTRAHIYALGAEENLKGEVMIWDSKPLISHNNNGNVEVMSTFDTHATLLVYATVAQWIEVGTIQGQDITSLETMIADHAHKNGWKQDTPFPFLLKGKVKSMTWHVIDWKEGMEHSHENHISSGAHGTKEGDMVDILGFYSTKHKAIWTHHSVNSHMHVRLADNTFSAHVDTLEADSLSLWLPQ